MIGWFVDVAWTDKKVSNISELEFLDVNRPWCLFQSGHSVPEEGSIISGVTATECYEEILKYIGNDFHTLYYGPTYNSSPKKQQYLELIKLCPGSTAYPNTWKKWLEENVVNKYVYYYFKNINRLLSINEKLSDSGWYVILSDGSLGTINPIIASPYINSCQLSGYVDFIGLDTANDGAYLDFERYFVLRFGFSEKTGTYSCQRIGPGDNVRNMAYRLVDMFKGTAPDFDIIRPDNPYEPDGPSGPGGGNGTFDDDSDQIIDSSLPTISSANTGFTRIYNPSLSQVQALARYLWTDESVIQTIWNHIKQYFEDPMQAIIGFNLVPVPVPNGGTQNFALMYIDTGVEMTVAASQFVDVDCGTFELKEYYGSALDYAPNTKVSCFLPFIGTVSLNTDEVMGRTLQVKYRVDICSGSCVAKIGVDGNFIYQYSGHCAINIPISSSDFSSYVSSAISVAQLAAGAIAAGAGGVMSSTAVDATQQTNQVVTTTQITNTARNPATGRQITTGTMTRVETRESPNGQSSTQASFSGITPQNISNTVGQIMSSKPNINHSGSFSGNSGYLGVRRPFLIIERPNMCMPSNFQALNGFPSMITLELSSCKGFTRVQQVQLTGFYATNPEQAEILQLLKSGVIL